jgi:hypothetical protein
LWVSYIIVTFNILGAIILVSYRMLVKPLVPPATTYTFQAYIQQSWPASLCLQSVATPCDKVRNYTEFVVTDIGKIDENGTICGKDGKQFDEQRDVSPTLLQLWAAPDIPAAYWGLLFQILL